MGKVDEDLKEIAALIAKAVRTGIKEFADGIQAKDFFAFISTFTDIPNAVEGWKNALDYLVDMTDEKETDLIEMVVAEVGEENREAVKVHIDAAASGYMLYLYWKNRSAKTPPPTV